MRRPLLAALAATIALSVNPAHAAAPGAGTAVAYATGFFRPNSGIVAVGTCTYAGYTLAGTAIAVGVLPGSEATLRIDCTLLNAFGSPVGSTSGSGVNEASASSTVIGGGVATTICATVIATSKSPGVPTAYGTMCAPVLPGNVK